jgi:Ni,Fe-hydrogenase III component G
MNTDELLHLAESKLAPWAMTTARVDANRLDVTIAPEHVPAATDALIIQTRLGYLAAITGLDHPANVSTEGSVEVLYTYCKNAAIVTLRVTVPYSRPVVPTLCGVVPSATIYERELIEMFGVQVTDTPNTDRLLLPDDWPPDVYPLRKSFTGLRPAGEA